MPAAVWPSFHCRPSTATTFLPSSASIRQTPTTLTNEVGSAPTVSLAKSSLSGSADTAPRSPIASATPEIVVALFLLFMPFLLLQQAALGCAVDGSSTTTPGRSGLAAHRGTTAAPPAPSQ